MRGPDKCGETRPDRHRTKAESQPHCGSMEPEICPSPSNPVPIGVGGGNGVGGGADDRSHGDRLLQLARLHGDMAANDWADDCLASDLSVRDLRQNCLQSTLMSNACRTCSRILKRALVDRLALSPLWRPALRSVFKCVGLSTLGLVTQWGTSTATNSRVERRGIGRPNAAGEAMHLPAGQGVHPQVEVVEC